MNTSAIKSFLYENFSYTENLETFDEPALGYSVRIGNSPYECIKVDLFYTENFIFPVQNIDGFRIADIREIAAMKIKAITQDEPRQKIYCCYFEYNLVYLLTFFFILVISETVLTVMHFYIIGKLNFSVIVDGRTCEGVPVSVLSEKSAEICVA